MKKIWIASMMMVFPLSLQAMESDDEHPHTSIHEYPPFFRIGLTRSPKIEFGEYNEASEPISINPTQPKDQGSKVSKQTSVPNKESLLKRVLDREYQKKRQEAFQKQEILENSIVRPNSPDYMDEKN